MATLLQLCQPFDHAVMAVIQQLSGAMMDKIMLVFTFLGEETFAILLLIAVYWCWDKRIGEYLLFSLYTAMSLNGLLKDIICRPRPFLNDEFSDLRYVKVKGLLVDTEHLSSSWSFPSGHSQTAGSIGFIGIQVAGGAGRGGNTADDIIEHQAAAIGINFQPDDLLILNAELLAILRGEVDVALGDDNAFLQFDLALGANQTAAGGTGQVTGFPHEGGDADGTGVGHGKLDLGLLADGAENRNHSHGLFGADDLDFFIGGKLAGLGKRFFEGQLEALAEQGLQILLGKVQMTGGSFY